MRRRGLWACPQLRWFLYGMPLGSKFLNQKPSNIYARDNTQNYLNCTRRDYFNYSFDNHGWNMVFRTLIKHTYTHKRDSATIPSTKSIRDMMISAAHYTHMSGFRLLAYDFNYSLHPTTGVWTAQYTKITADITGCLFSPIVLYMLL